MRNKLIQKLPLTSDIVFKRVFSKEGNEDILKSLLEAVLERKIKKVVVKNPELPRNLYDSKSCVLDVKAELDRNILCNIEMQMTKQNFSDKRTMFYTARMTADDALKRGEDYTKIKNIIVINLLNFEYYLRNCYHNIAHMKFEDPKEYEKVDMGYETQEDIAIHNLEMHFIEIPKFIKKNPVANTDLEKWLWLLAGKEEKLDMAKEENESIKKAIEIIEQMSTDNEEWRLYRSRELAIMDYNVGMRVSKEEGLAEGLIEGRERGLKEGRKEGQVEGERKTKIEIAKKLLKLGMSIEDIEKVTQLSKEEIGKCKKENKQQ